MKLKRFIKVRVIITRQCLVETDSVFVSAHVPEIENSLLIVDQVWPRPKKVRDKQESISSFVVIIKNLFLLGWFKFQLIFLSHNRKKAVDSTEEIPIVRITKIITHSRDEFMVEL